MGGEAGAAGAPYRPFLARYPDARRAALPLFDPVAFGYLALSLGGPVASVCALYNGLLLRQPRLCVRAVAIGALSFASFFVAVALFFGGGSKDVDLIRLLGTLLHVLFGVLLATSQWRHFRGHRSMGGVTVPLLGTVVAGVVLRFVLPTRVLLLLLGLPP